MKNHLTSKGFIAFSAFCELKNEAVSVKNGTWEYEISSSSGDPFSNRSWMHSEQSFLKKTMLSLEMVVLCEALDLQNKLNAVNYIWF